MSLKHYGISLILALGVAAAEAQLPSGIGWHSIPNSRLRSVCAAENGFPQVAGSTGCPAITSAWNGGVFDTQRNRLIIWGGGHNDYYGNEIYAFSLNTLAMERITNPGLPIASSCVTGIVNNTQPNSRHTYDGIEYIEHLDKMFVFGGSLACGGGHFSSDTWLFDFKANAWQRRSPTGQAPTGDAGMLTAYDPVSGFIYLHDRAHLYTYDAANDRYTRLTSSSAGLGYHLAATIDPNRRLFVIVGYDSAAGGGRVWTYDIGSASPQKRGLSTSGSTSIQSERYPGLAYDPIADRIAAWGGNDRNSVYLLNPDTGAWTRETYSGGPSAMSNGTHGRWRYSPSSGVFVVANQVDSNVYILRRSNLALPNAPSNVSAE